MSTLKLMVNNMIFQNLSN